MVWAKRRQKRQMEKGLQKKLQDPFDIWYIQRDHFTHATGEGGGSPPPAPLPPQRGKRAELGMEVDGAGSREGEKK